MPPRNRAALPLPWLIRLSTIASAACLAVALYLGLSSRTAAIQNATNEMAVQADTLARQLESDLALFDVALHEASNQARLPPRDADPAAAKAAFPELPLTALYLWFMNVLNEVGDVVADSRSNVSRPVNFAGRDYFQDHLKNPSDTLMIGRPFATAPNQHASIPLSRRLNHPDGSFAGVVVAGIRLTWLTDLISHPLPGPHTTITIRRDDGLILMRAPFDADAIGRGGAADPYWAAFLRTGLASATDDEGGVRLFRRLTVPLVVELSLAPADIASGQRSWLFLVPLLAVIPGLCALGMSLMARRLQHRGDAIEAAARTANDEHMRLLANMSHELRTPLTGILGQAEMIREEGALNDRQTTRMTRLTEAGTLMRNIINRVIDVARPEDRIHRPAQVACDLDHLVHTCLAMVEGEARRKSLLLSSAIATATPRKVMLAADLVQQVLINLLMNAVKFTNHGTVNLRVTGDAARLWFEVADTGPGIPPRKRRRLFREYDRLDVPESRTEGTGLGLSITERFVHRMGGRIGSIERKGGGSIFWVELPTAEPDPSIVTAGNVSSAPVFAPRHLRILLADDLDLTRTVTADYLRSAGHVVTEVPDGETAVAKVREHDYDVVLTDMRMPVVDGLEVTRRVRALPGHRGRTPVVLVTADLVAIGRGASGHTGVDVCVMKPFTRPELLAAVATAARLTPVPEAGRPDGPVLDAAALSELQGSLGHADFAAQLDAAAHRIEHLIELLDGPDANDSPTLSNAVHDLIGVAGLMGLPALAASLRRFDIGPERTATDRTAPDRMVPVADLRQAAAEALQALRFRREPVAAADR